MPGGDADAARKMPGEVALAHRGHVRPDVRPRFLLEVTQHPQLQVAQGAVFAELCREMVAELGLSARALQNQHELARHRGPATGVPQSSSSIASAMSIPAVTPAEV